MPAGGDIFFAAALFLAGKGFLGNRETAVVDQAGLVVAGHLVAEGLVHRPGVDATLWAVVVVDWTRVETECFRSAVELTCRTPGLLRHLLSLGRRRGEEGVVAACIAFAPFSVSS
jgi:hypothetical protein